MAVNLEKMFGSAVEELEKMLNSRTVVGEPITHEGTTVIPLVSIGFGFGAGGGEGQEPSGSGQGSGGGTAGGGGVKPVALIIIDDGGVRLETIKGATASVWGQMAEAVAEKVGGGKGDEKGAKKDEPSAAEE